MRKKILIILACIFIQACTQPTKVELVDLSNELSSWDYFSLQFNAKFEENIKRGDGSIALTTYDTATTKRIPSDFSIHLYPNIHSSCTPTIMGTNTIQNYARDTGGKTVFGIVSSKEKPYEIHTFDDSLCLPPRTSDDADSYWRNHGYDGAGAYVLCSQKEEKTVLICISQMTDNPKLAEEIFSTFKWLP